MSMAPVPTNLSNAFDRPRTFRPIAAPETPVTTISTPLRRPTPTQAPFPTPTPSASSAASAIDVACIDDPSLRQSLSLSTHLDISTGFLTDYTKIDRKAVQPSYERGRGARRFLSFNHLQESLIADDILAPPASPGKAFSGGTNCERKLPRGSFSRLTNFDRVRRAQTTYVSTSDVTASSSDPDVADSIPHVAVSRPREHAKSKRKGRGNILSRIFRRGRSSAEAAPSSNAVPSEVDAEATSVAHSFQRSSIDGYHRRTMPSTPSPSRSLHARKGSVDLWAMDPLTPDDGYTIQRQEICDSASTVSDDSEHEYRGGQSRGGPVCATSAPRSLSMTNRMLKRTVGKFANVHGMVDRRMSVSDLSMSPSPTNP